MNRLPNLCEVYLFVQDLLRVPGGFLRLSQQTSGAVHETTQRHDPLPDQIVSLCASVVSIFEIFAISKA